VAAPRPTAAPPKATDHEHNHDDADNHGHGDDAHEDHHRRPLPFVVVDEAGKISRVVQPATEHLMGRDAGPDRAEAPSGEMGGMDHLHSAATGKSSRGTTKKGSGKK
jgi:hypothetical protein